jgi:hypothetical protein
MKRTTLSDMVRPVSVVQSNIGPGQIHILSSRRVGSRSSLLDRKVLQSIGLCTSPRSSLVTFNWAFAMAL